MENGEGLKQLMPPLKSSDFLKGNPGKVVCMIKYGHEDTVVVNGEIYAGLMPANPDLTEIQITNILNYINNEWGNDYGFTPPDSVFSWLNACKTE